MTDGQYVNPGSVQKLIDQREIELPRPAAAPTIGSTAEPAGSGVPGAGD